MPCFLWMHHINPSILLDFGPGGRTWTPILINLGQYLVFGSNFNVGPYFKFCWFKQDHFQMDLTPWRQSRPLSTCYVDFHKPVGALARGWNHWNLDGPPEQIGMNPDKECQNGLQGRFRGNFLCFMMKKHRVYRELLSIFPRIEFCFSLWTRCGRWHPITSDQHHTEPCLQNSGKRKTHFATDESIWKFQSMAHLRRICSVCHTELR